MHRMNNRDCHWSDYPTLNYFVRGTILAAGLCILQTELFSNESPIITKESQLAIDTGLAYLAERQNENGSIGDGAQAENVGVVSLVGIDSG